jgi:hypothetical protein
MLMLWTLLTVLGSLSVPIGTWVWAEGVGGGWLKYSVALTIGLPLAVLNYRWWTFMGDAARNAVGHLEESAQNRRLFWLYAAAALWPLIGALIGYWVMKTARFLA